MKYPQLVSTRAVNAISDWLVSRLEQLGVEAPLIYSRLLLSLLQSSVQINDPIEFSNLETFLANRKGNSKRYPPCDTDTLRKITAVQCLMDIVSSEQEITKIENLVDELCEKVNDIEKQSTNLEEDDDLQIAASALNSVLTATTTPSSSFNKKTNEALSTATITIEGGEGGGSTSKLSEITAISLSKRSKEQIASDAEDPRKRYYRAFPALSKEMEDSIGLLRRNTKSLTWPVDRKINSSNKNATNSSGVVVATVNTSASVIEKSTISTGGGGPSALLGNSQRGDSNTVLCNTAGVKRKTKRRRNQAMSKGKSTAGNNTRKNSYCGGSSSPTWDTDFEGSWEMGRDLIKEFIVKQNNRNRSTSESAAYNMASSGSGSGSGNNENHEKRMKPMVNEVNVKQAPMATEEGQEQYQQQEANIQNDNQMAKVSTEPCVVEISYCDDLVENSKSDDTLASVSEITEGSLSTARRLYERDISNDSLNEQSTQDHQHYQQSSSASSSEQLDFAQFKAKFNSSVEALWKNSNSSGGSTSNINQSMLQTSIVTDSGAASVAPYRSEDLKNFWTNYYSHHYDVDKFKQLNFSECCDYSMTAGASAIGGSTTHNSDVHSDYFSMPTISSTSISGGGGGGADDFDKSVGGKRAGGKSSPIGVFLQNTIWSENSNASYPDTDESFFMKVLNSTSSTQKSQDQFKMDITGSDKSYYYPYQTSKWSEGINGVPHGNNITVQHHYYQQQQQQQQQPLIITSSSSSSSISTMDHSARSCYTNEFADSTPSSSSSYLGGNANWQIPAGNNLQADVKSWSSSNPTSLTELYGGGGSAAASLGKKNSSNFDRNAAATGVTTTSSTTSNTSIITLANHSTTASGFIAYSRIKSYVKLIDAKPIVKWQKPDAEYHQLTSTTAPDDENLLTSERTHFHPIKMSYADGHTFEISSNLDTVDFERSESGYLYLESEKYLEYTRSDTLAEEDSSVAGHYHASGSSLSRDCASSVASSTKSSQSEFIIRFRLRTTDKSCQTESNVIVPSVLRSSLVYQLASAHLPRPPMQTAHQAVNDDDDDEDDWMDIGCSVGGGSGGNVKDDEECVSMDQWSMAEIGKRCVDNNNSSHTLWGMCPACNNDMKSIPANRMLKDELNVEGDEIMSDLRYMQDLYIGSDWEDQNGTREDDGGDDDDDDDTDLDAETIRDCEFYQAMATPAGCGDLDEEDQQQKDILYNVNKLIADLLRPENAQTLANALGAVGVGCVGGVGGCFGVVGGGAAAGGGCTRKFGAEIDGVVECKDEKYIGGLWNSDENIIWKKEFNPIDIFSRLNNNNNDSFLEKLNWEYSNLAEIWGKASPDKTGLSIDEENCSAKVDPVELDTEKQHSITTETTNAAFEDEENIKIACKNMKNLLKSTTITPPNGNSAIFEMNERDCKRMQCFLNSNKFKISNRFDRKRRHSASQNVCSNNNNNNITYNNNNNNNVYDNNNFKLSLFGSTSDPPPTNALTTTTTITTTTITTTTTTTTTKATTKDTLSDYGRNINDDDEHQEHDYIQQQHYNDDHQDNNSQATIITCKYWTTMHPIISGSVVGDGEISTDDHSIDAQAAAASFFIDKNSQFIDGLPSITLNTSSILKHVTLVSRPLTR